MLGYSPNKIMFFQVESVREVLHKLTFEANSHILITLRKFNGFL
jgi:hypothetical protein